MKTINISKIKNKEILVLNEKITMICFVFAQGQGLPNHTHNGMAVIQVISGTVEMRFVGGQEQTLEQGDVLEFDARIEHHVIATQPAKVIVTIVN